MTSNQIKSTICTVVNPWPLSQASLFDATISSSLVDFLLTSAF